MMAIRQAVTAVETSTKTWRDHCLDSERYTPIMEFDDGSAILWGASTGGADPRGVFGGLTLMRIHADGAVEFRKYTATEEWTMALSKGDSNYLRSFR
jgi:hypothetical protein